MKTFLVHALVLAAAIGSASYVWLRDKAPAAAVRRDVMVWRGRAADVDRMEYTKKARHVVLEGKTDGAGRYFVGTAEGEATDAGPSKITFVSVAPATKIAEKMAELRALRDLGKVDGERNAELGLKEPEGQVRITVRGTTHTLDLGMVAPGGTDRYVRETETGNVFVVEAEPIHDLEGGEHVLVEQQLHEFPLDPDVDKVTVSSDDKKRVFVRRGAAARRFFADPSTPEKNEETVTTWMSKIERLRPMEFSASPPNLTGEKIRLEYTGRGTTGFLEIARAGGAEGDVYLRTERTRLWAKTTRSVGEQVLSEVHSILK
jgi:hypothetical protein